MAVWVVAVEYAGPALELLQPAPRRPILEHAYDLDTGQLAMAATSYGWGFHAPPGAGPSRRS